MKHVTNETLGQVSRHPFSQTTIWKDNLNVPNLQSVPSSSGGMPLHEKEVISGAGPWPPLVLSRGPRLRKGAQKRGIMRLPVVDDPVS